VEAVVSKPIRVAHVTTVDLTLRFLLLGQMQRLLAEGYEVVGISAPGPWTAELEALGIRHVPWPHATRSWDPRSDVRAFAELLGIFRRERFDLVHTHNPKPGIMGRIAARVTGVPCVVNTVHGLYATPEDPATKRRVVLALEALAARFSDLELYQSEEDLTWARRARVVPGLRSVLLGNGTDLSRFDPSSVSAERMVALRDELGIPRDAPVVGTVGRLVQEKGYREFFHAAARIRSTMPEARFVAIGGPDPGKGDAISEKEVSEAGDHVTFTGWRKDVRDLLAMMDVFVLPSWREGMPRSAIEAAAMGKPMVLTDIRGCREVVRDGLDGLLVPPRSRQLLTGAISRLLVDPELRHRLGQSARARARERFDEEKVVERVVARYRELLARKGRIAPAPPGRGADAPDQVRIRRALRRDAPQLARLHRESLPGAFLPSLGDRFLSRLYRALAEDPAAVAVVAENGGGVLGFATAVPSVKGFYRRFYLRHGISAVVAAAPRLLRPTVLRRVRETASYPQDGRGLPEAELLSIAVDGRSRARGVGSSLARAILEGLAERSVDDVRVVVGADNVPANRFYEKLGFTRARQIAVHDGLLSNVWVIRCSSSLG
jgi:glycosyltransferase involved in cell wall biosynthesis/ribosomal protein S18 acetylase RimI-like enzyme